MYRFITIAWILVVLMVGYILWMAKERIEGLERRVLFIENIMQNVPNETPDLPAVPAGRI